jgi:hypothetical protein
LKGKALEYGIVALVVLFIGSYEWLRRFIGLPQQLVGITIFALALAAYCVARIWLLRRRISALQATTEPWEVIERDFNSLGEKGFFLFDELRDDAGVPLGVVIAGPTGVFVLNVRSNPPRGLPLEKIEQLDADTLLIGGRRALAKPLAHARQAAARVQQWFAARGLSNVPVTPLLIYPRWKIGARPAQQDVIVANAQTFASEIQNAPQRLEPRDLIPVCELLAASRSNAAQPS